MNKQTLLLISALLPLGLCAQAVEPTLADVPYGAHPKQVLDFYKADTPQPAPVMFFIHGGSWLSGDKKTRITNLEQCLNAGISVVSISYRFIPEATADGLVPPVQGPLNDAARALQFVRSKAPEWNIDKTRIAAVGNSAGGCSALWLALHDDLADPGSTDPVARESTRLCAAAGLGAQTSLDPQQMKAWIPNILYGGHAFGFPNFKEFLAGREKILPWIAAYSPYELITAGDPPIFLQYGDVPALGQEQKSGPHGSNFGVEFAEKCKSVGVECEFMYPGATEVQYKALMNFLKAKLKGPQG
jgi:acetyl esterase/lipase